MDVGGNNMKKFIVEDSFWELFPNAKLGVVLLKDYTNELNSEEKKEVEEILKESNILAKKHLKEEVFSENAIIQVYRKAFQKFKTKKGVRSSIEALLKRIDTGKEIPNIEPLVDIYNSASLRFALPVGAEDIETFEGDLRLKITEGGDEFYALGDEENSPTLEGEVCYRDDKGAVCRCFNWRDGKRTMITENTKKAFLVIEAVNSDRDEEIVKALEEIAVYAGEELGAKKVKLELLKKDNNTLEL